MLILHGHENSKGESRVEMGRSLLSTGRMATLQKMAPLVGLLVEPLHMRIANETLYRST